MKLEDFGFNSYHRQNWLDLGLDDLEPGRVIAEHKERYTVATPTGEKDAEITGNLRYSAKSRTDFPAVGDWVALSVYSTGPSVIHKILPRASTISRQAIGHFGEIQIIATNIDCAFLIQAVDRDFNLNRLERYLTICNASNVSPIVVLTKTDLRDEVTTARLIADINQRINNIPIIAISNETQTGYEDLRRFIGAGKTYCMLGSSGVGKSTLLNNLSGRSVMKTDTISQSNHKGRHVTSHRELQLLDNGGILIDTPGMREIGITDSAGGLETTFEKIVSLAKTCRFNDCIHTTETGCRVIDAVEDGSIDRHAYENFLKMEREKEYFEATVAEKRKKEKDFGKMLKNYKHEMNRKRD